MRAYSTKHKLEVGFNPEVLGMEIPDDMNEIHYCERKNNFCEDKDPKCYHYNLLRRIRDEKS